MEYITVCSVLMSDSSEEIADEVWYSLWEKDAWPRREVSPGDIVYFYEEPGGRLRWKAVVTGISRLEYDDRLALREELLVRFPEASVDIPALGKKDGAGYCLAYRVEPLLALSIPKPDGFVLPLLGWLRVDARVRSEWALTE